MLPAIWGLGDTLARVALSALSRGGRLSSKQCASLLEQLNWPNGQPRWSPRTRKGKCYHCGLLPSSGRMSRNLCDNCRHEGILLFYKLRLFCHALLESWVCHSILGSALRCCHKSVPDLRIPVLSRKLQHSSSPVERIQRE